MSVSARDGAPDSLAVNGVIFCNGFVELEHEEGFCHDYSLNASGTMCDFLHIGRHNDRRRGSHTRAVRQQGAIEHI